MMSKRLVWMSGLAAVAGLAIVVAVTLALVPQQTHPAFAAALEFAEAAGRGEAAADALLAPPLRGYAAANCPDGRAAGCIQAYTPPEWGRFLSVVFRRAAPDGPAWNVELIATYAQDLGFSGVCIYLRLEPEPDGAWRVARWAGYVSCGDPASRNMAANPAAPNRAP